MPLCRAAHSQLLLVDLQTRLFAAMAEEDRNAVLSVAGILARAASALAIPVSYTEQYPRGLGPTEPGLLTVLPDGALRFEKTGFSCCAADGLEHTLKSVDRRQIVIVGQETHVCVLQTAFDLQKSGYQVFVVEDGVCSRKPAHKRNALERMARGGIVVTNVESVLFEWLGDAAHPQFKALSALIR
ncbi:isochorismatase family protein [Methylococcus sp. EFPC2]|uniref:isochorismatase family protein n=1 Tax=Methylococcus sp. EFPC2 TaxID=2812648 RepID=UPI00196783F0|nr:isochorismatase family protein [Methylococcus sp. EFPC2]QSA96998.1 isochorismatase family protein [Methylococcus sp. EFPC2]